jgi:hypothetical protein
MRTDRMTLMRYGERASRSPPRHTIWPVAALVDAGI